MALGLSSITQTSIAVETNEPVIVTATRTAQTTDETLASVTVITQEDIEKTGAKTLAEVLSGVQGINVTSNGAFGKVTSIFTRGTESDHTILLIDGIKFRSATSGAPSLQFIPVSQIERIEIVRGPRSSLYGSEAIGGVIQIFTKKGKKKNIIEAETGFGSYDSAKANIGTSGSAGAFDYAFNVGRFQTQGIDILQTSDPDKDGYKNNSFGFNAKYSPDSRFNISANILHAEGETEVDNDYYNNNSSEFTNQVIGTTLSYSPTNNFSSKLLLGRGLDKNYGYGSNSPSITTTKYYQASWQNDFYFEKNRVISAGLDYQKDHVNSTTNYALQERYNNGLYIQYLDKFGKTDLLAALRHDDNQQFGEHTTGNLGFGFPITSSLRITGSFGTAFKAPTLNELYYPGGYGNPNLQPEESKSLEIGLSAKEGWGQWNISSYTTKIKNLIADYPATNLDRTEIDGFEANFVTSIYGWNTKFEMTLLDPKDKSSSKQLLKRPKRSFKLNVDKNFGKWDIGTNIITQSRRLDYYGDFMGGYTVVNLFGNYSLDKNWEIRGHLDNLFDKNYETSDRYNTQDRSLFVTIAYKTK